VTRPVALVLALVVAFAPAALARTVKPAKHPVKCAAQTKAKPKKRCKRRHSASRGHHPARPPHHHAAAPEATPAPAPVLVAPPAATDPFPVTAAPDPTPAPAVRSRLGVTAREFSLVLSRTTLAAGDALVELQNFGEDPHDLRIERVDGTGPRVDLPLAEAGAVQSGDATLTPGQYKLYCALPGHDALGMHATLTVGG
jgi:plastocyanin